MLHLFIATFLNINFLIIHSKTKECHGVYPERSEGTNKVTAAISFFTRQKKTKIKIKKENNLTGMDGVYGMKKQRQK